jgi:hypothetical protein
MMSFRTPTQPSVVQTRAEQRVRASRTRESLNGENAEKCVREAYAQLFVPCSANSQVPQVLPLAVVSPIGCKKGAGCRQP